MVETELYHSHCFELVWEDFGKFLLFLTNLTIQNFYSYYRNNYESFGFGAIVQGEPLNHFLKVCFFDICYLEDQNN